MGFEDVAKGLFWAAEIVPVVLAVLLHEIAHGAAALYFGDETAKNAKRLSLNPLRHVDVFGTIVFPAFLILSRSPFVFGWAKPVPVDFSKLRRPKRDMIWVALAGPATNFVLAVLALMALSFYKGNMNGWTGLFLVNSVLFNFSIMAFNLIPVLPLDGGRILTGILPLRAAIAFSKTERYGFLTILFLLVALPWIGNGIGIDLDVVSNFLGWTVRKCVTFFGTLFGLSV